MESDLKVVMDRKHRSVIASLDDVELINIVRQDILENDCYRLAAELIITSEQNRTSHMKVDGSKEILNRLMAFLDRDSHSMTLKCDGKRPQSSHG
jgi:hypothetical protein